MSAYYEFKLPAKILSGDGALEHIPHELDSLGAHRPLLLSDQGLEQVGTVKIVQAALRQGGMAGGGDLLPDSPGLLHPGGQPDRRPLPPGPVRQPHRRGGRIGD